MILPFWYQAFLILLEYKNNIVITDYLENKLKIWEKNKKQVTVL